MIALSWRRTSFRWLPSIFSFPPDESGRGVCGAKWLWFSLQYYSEQSETDAVLASYCAYKNLWGARAAMERLNGMRGEHSVRKGK